ncbi:polygalacturonase-like [Diorhabda carinulata]|uniref:polygalacturonase-like n=1 Tax=Diorhabda carinulata TaxID=1163345 RepID=UPI0025A0D804|nr:polygalacturonase-like [Diorhabda carinulata]
MIELKIKNLVFSIFFMLVTSDENNCRITEFPHVSTIVEKCTDIIISNLTVPAGETLRLDLQKGSKLTFEGITVFEVAYWQGYLLHITGDQVLVQGAPGSILNAQGEKYWDGQGGDGGVTKPRFLHVVATGGSIFKNLYLLNCPRFCVGVGGSDFTITGWTIDVVAGNTRGGLNTDGFGIGGHNILIENSVVMNQDDCVVVHSGSGLFFKNLQCYGSHGLSFSVGSSTNDNTKNSVISNITFSDCLVANGLYGIHIKTKKGVGTIEDVTYQNIALIGIQEDGIYINQDYGDIGNVSRQFEITELNMINIYGSLQGQFTRPVHIVCNENKCSNWNWTNINLIGSGKSFCSFIPSGFSC